MEEKEKLLLFCYECCRDNKNNVSVFLDDLIEYFESSKNVDKNNVLNILLYLKNGE